MVVAMSVIVGVIEIALFIVVMLELAIMCMLIRPGLRASDVLHGPE